MRWGSPIGKQSRFVRSSTHVSDMIEKWDVPTNMMSDPLPLLPLGLLGFHVPFLPFHLALFVCFVLFGCVVSCSVNIKIEDTLSESIKIGELSRNSRGKP